ncbi:MAG: hypothetical protein CM1200mP15_12160 [Dehalococcoidia bacterium]|nr:MAG: hypothetical protein CM1200mP15_12160 [Dehalococcoidia bacterium]
MCNSAPSADGFPCFDSPWAVANVAGPNGNREIPVEEFCTGPGQNVLGSGEILVSVDCSPSG